MPDEPRRAAQHSQADARERTLGARRQRRQRRWATFSRRCSCPTRARRPSKEARARDRDPRVLGSRIRDFRVSAAPTGSGTARSRRASERCAGELGDEALYANTTRRARLEGRGRACGGRKQGARRCCCGATCRTKQRRPRSKRCRAMNGSRSMREAACVSGRLAESHAAKRHRAERSIRRQLHRADAYCSSLGFVRARPAVSCSNLCPSRPSRVRFAPIAALFVLPIAALRDPSLERGRGRRSSPPARRTALHWLGGALPRSDRAR